MSCRGHAAWDLQTAMRWLTGSLNGATWARIVPLGIATRRRQSPSCCWRRPRPRGPSPGRRHRRRARSKRAPARGMLLIARGRRPPGLRDRRRGPIAFVAFMAGPIAARLVGPGGSLVAPAGLVGAVLVLGADLSASTRSRPATPSGSSPARSARPISSSCSSGPTGPEARCDHRHRLAAEHSRSPTATQSSSTAST